MLSGEPALIDLAVTPLGSAGQPVEVPESCVNPTVAPWLVETMLAVAAVLPDVVAVSVPELTTDAMLMVGRFTRPLVSLTCVFVVVPSAKVYPLLNVVVTERPAVGTPPTVTVT